MTTRGRFSLLCGLGWVSLTVTALAFVPLVPVDETRYAGIAWEMLVDGDWLVPHLNGAPYSHKPPLLFWWLDAGWSLFGPSAWWARLGAGLFSLAGLGLTARLAGRLWPAHKPVRYLAPTILIGSALWAGFTPAVMFDLLLAACVLVALSGVVEAALGRALLGWSLAGVGIGLGLLAKGPVALLHVVPVIVLGPVWKKPLDWRRWYAGALGSLALATAIALIWAAPAAWHGGAEYAEAIFWRQSAGRVVDSFAHQRPVWWYVPLLPLVLFPWLIWPPSWRVLWRLKGATDWRLKMLVSWLAPTFLAFCLVSGKQVHYLLPMFPGFALLLARGLGGEPIRLGNDDQLLPAGAFVAGAAMLALGPVVGTSQGWPHWLSELPIWPALATGALSVFVLVMGRSLNARVAVLSGSSIGLMLVVFLGILTPAAPEYDLAPAGRFVSAALREGRPVAFVGEYPDYFQFFGRLRHPIAVIGKAGVKEWARKHPDGYIGRVEKAAVGSLGTRPEYVQPLVSRWLVFWRARQVAGRHARRIRSRAPPRSPSSTRSGLGSAGRLD